MNLYRVYIPTTLAERLGARRLWHLVAASSPDEAMAEVPGASRAVLVMERVPESADELEAIA